MSTLDFSIVVPAHNEEKHLSVSIKALTSLDYPRDKYEIIVVDNGSTDNTAETAGTLGADKVIRCEFGTVATARNLGSKQANGATLVFIDADCEVARDHLSLIAKMIKQQECITGAPVVVPADASWVARLWRARSSQDNQRVTIVNYINSGNLAVPKTVFNKLGGFNASLESGEDFEFCSRAAKLRPIVVIPELKVIHHGEPRSLLSFFLQQIWHGAGAFGALKERPFDKPLIGTLFFVLLLIGAAFGAIELLTSHKATLLTSSTILLLLLLFGSALISGNLPKKLIWIPPLLLIWFVYYAGRFIALLLLAFGKSFRSHR